MATGLVVQPPHGWRWGVNAWPRPPLSGFLSWPTRFSLAARADMRRRKTYLRECLGQERDAVERLIAERFACMHGAQPGYFLPRLYRLEDDSGEPLAAFGMRCAGDERLYLERYLDMPVERAIGERLGVSPPSRMRIVEIGNLATFSHGATRTLLPAITGLLAHQDCEWVVFTATKLLRNSFGRLGGALTELAIADPAFLGDEERARWGSYFSHDPRVMCGEVSLGLRLWRGKIAWAP